MLFPFFSSSPAKICFYTSTRNNTLPNLWLEVSCFDTRCVLFPPTDRPKGHSWPTDDDLQQSECGPPKHSTYDAYLFPDWARAASRLRVNRRAKKSPNGREAARAASDRWEGVKPRWGEVDVTVGRRRQREKMRRQRGEEAAGGVLAQRWTFCLMLNTHTYTWSRSVFFFAIATDVTL